MSTASKFERKSDRYKTLEVELSILRKHLLPAKFDPTGVYASQVYTKTFAYRVLAHAEFESYLEDRVRELYGDAISAWQQLGRVSKVLTCMLAFSGLQMDVPPSTVTPTQNQKPDWDAKIRLSGKIVKVGIALHQMIVNNHGVREKNILGMLLPVGIEADELDNSWLASMDSFGRERGLVAHSSASGYRTQQLPDPQSELNKVYYLLSGIKDIDLMFNKLQE